ncbi:kinase-like protein [Artomyces pyxidatus]|uniref:Kinase-like protein n=1 Tax=Artomyces pyxidatus TaxID=48021 RepID=A0ACB8SHH1_9AGAM|nr:kinase-like protein [Artomyces pyxidatus]
MSSTLKSGPSSPRPWASLLPSPNSIGLARVDLLNASLRVGRAKDNDTVISHPSIGFYHCVIQKSVQLDGSPLAVVHDKSPFGTYVNYSRVEPFGYQRMANGDTLSFSSSPDAPLTYTFITIDEPFRGSGGFGARYILGQQIGEGGFSSVFQALDRQSGAKRAVKVLHCSTTSAHRQTSLSDALREVQIMQNIFHPQVLKFYAAFHDRQTVRIVSELCPFGNLLSLIFTLGTLDEASARVVTLQVVLALECLHTLGVVHRDLKSENILLSSIDPLHIKVADYGLASFLRPGYTLQGSCGTPGYIAPEVRFGTKGYDSKADCWSLGVTLFEMLSGSLPGIQGSPFATNWAALPDQLSDAGLDFLRRLLETDPRIRMRTRDSLRHLWLLSLIYFPLDRAFPFR